MFLELLRSRRCTRKGTGNNFGSIDICSTRCSSNMQQDLSMLLCSNHFRFESDNWVCWQPFLLSIFSTILVQKLTKCDFGQNSLFPKLWKSCYFFGWLLVNEQNEKEFWLSQQEIGMSWLNPKCCSSKESKKKILANCFF